jgi:ribosomal protein S18 acetylase RimI-like enzyme
MHPAWAPNQPHRADVAKLIVHRRSRRNGIGKQLMESIEDAAREAGFTLLTLDARQDGVAVRLYRRIGWTEVGVIPRYALNPDGKTPRTGRLFFTRIYRHEYVDVTREAPPPASRHDLGRTQCDSCRPAGAGKR